MLNLFVLAPGLLVVLGVVFTRQLPCWQPVGEVAVVVVVDVLEGVVVE